MKANGSAERYFAGEGHLIFSSPYTIKNLKNKYMFSAIIISGLFRNKKL